MQLKYLLKELYRVDELLQNLPDSLEHLTLRSQKATAPDGCQLSERTQEFECTQLKLVSSELATGFAKLGLHPKHEWCYLASKSAELDLWLVDFNERLDGVALPTGLQNLDLRQWLQPKLEWCDSASRSETNDFWQLFQH